MAVSATLGGVTCTGTAGTVEILDIDNNAYTAVLQSWTGTISCSGSVKRIKLLLHGKCTVNSVAVSASADRMDSIEIVSRVTDEAKPEHSVVNSVSATLVAINMCDVECNTVNANVLTVNQSKFTITSGVVATGHIWLVDSAVEAGSTGTAIKAPYVMVDNSNLTVAGKPPIDVNENGLSLTHCTILTNNSSQLICSAAVIDPETGDPMWFMYAKQGQRNRSESRYVKYGYEVDPPSGEFAEAQFATPYDNFKHSTGYTNVFLHRWMDQETDPTQEFDVSIIEALDPKLTYVDGSATRPFLMDGTELTAQPKGTYDATGILPSDIETHTEYGGVLTWKFKATSGQEGYVDFQAKAPDYPYQAAGFYTFTISKLKPGATGTVVLELQVDDPTYIDDYTANKAYVKNSNAEDAEFISTSVTCALNGVVNSTEDLKVGDKITYTIKYTAATNVDVDGDGKADTEVTVTVVDIIHKGLTRISSTPANAGWTSGTYRLESLNIVWDLFEPDTDIVNQTFNKLDPKDQTTFGFEGWEYPESTKQVVGENGMESDPPSNSAKVDVGDLLSYNIFFESSNDDKLNQRTTTTTVIDPLDTAVDFISASYGEKEVYTHLEAKTPDERFPNSHWYGEVGDDIITECDTLTDSSYISMKNRPAGSNGTVRVIGRKCSGLHEVYPGAGEPVEPGDEINYSIEWKSDARDEWGRPVAGIVAITDDLDYGVEFVEATPTPTYIRTTKEGRTRLIWHIDTTLVGSKLITDNGIVGLTVRVKDGVVDQIRNKASIRVSYGSEYNTNAVFNPILGQPATAIGAQAIVQIDGEVQPDPIVRSTDMDVWTAFDIDWENTSSKSADVLVSYDLDEILYEFISIENDEVKLIADDEYSITNYRNNLTIVYNPTGKAVNSVPYDYTGTVKWIFEEMPVDSKDHVQLVVRVNDNALDKDYVSNQPSVKPSNMDGWKDLNATNHVTSHSNAEHLDVEYIRPGSVIDYRLFWYVPLGERLPRQHTLVINSLNSFRTIETFFKTNIEDDLEDLELP